MQVREYLDGTIWARWLTDDIQPPPRWPHGRAAGGENCAWCNAGNAAWMGAPPTLARPRKVDLIYECDRCGHTTYQGRLPPLAAVGRERPVR